MTQTTAIVCSNEEITPGIHLLWVEAPEIAASAQPGQFVMVRCSQGHDPLLRRPMSVHQAGANGVLALLFEVVGRGTHWLARRKEGEVVDLLGPLGNGFEVHCHKLLLVAGGMGIAALGFLAEKAATDGHHVTLLYGAKTRDKMYPLDRFTPAISAVEVVTEDGSLGKEGLATDILADFDHIAGLTAADTDDLTGPDQIFACGPTAMYEAMAGLDWLRGKNVQVSMEARMGCGFGGCYGCAIETKEGPKLVCRDGPVFQLNEIFW